MSRCVCTVFSLLDTRGWMLLDDQTADRNRCQIRLEPQNRCTVCHTVDAVLMYSQCFIFSISHAILNESQRCWVRCFNVFFFFIKMGIYRYREDIVSSFSSYFQICYFLIKLNYVGNHHVMPFYFFKYIQMHSVCFLYVKLMSPLFYFTS